MSTQFDTTTALQQVTVEQVAWLLDHFPFTRQINAIHLHHSRRPNHRQYRGRETVLDMARQHVEGYGFAAIAQHLTVAPDGSIWLGRNWNLPPASAAGFNGSAASGPLMIMLVGDFDYGQDRFDLEQGQQAKQTLALIALIQERFELVPETLRFHCDLSNVTSPGSSVDYREFLKALRKERSAQRKDQKQGDPHPMTNHETQEMNLLLDKFARHGSAQTDGQTAELSEYGQQSRDFNYFVSGGSASNATATGDRALFGPTITTEMVEELRPHVINLTLGRFSTSGAMQTDGGDVDAIFEDYLLRALEDRPRGEPLRLLFYAHGGLVGEKDALLQAYQHIPWWRKNHIYPIYFVWETGFWPMFAKSLGFTRDRSLTREALTDGAIEKLARGLGGPRVWQAIKSSAQTATLDGQGGAHYLIDKMKAFLGEHGDRVELHAVGHSAGSIFHSFFVPAMIKECGADFKTVHFLAPAITTEDFKMRMTERMGQGIDHLAIFTLRKELERKDPTAAPLYNRSILYLVSHAMEPEPNTPVLGLEESLRADRDLVDLFGLRRNNGGRGEIIWAKSASSSGRSASQSTSHVHFTCDPATMNSVLRRVRAVDDNARIEAFPNDFACGGRNLNNAFELPSELEELVEAGLLNPRFLFEGVAATGEMAASTGGGQIAVKKGAVQAPIGGGRRRALCIGIDEYEVSPLSGCVADARLWVETLQSLGFDTPTLLINGAATRSVILKAIEDLVLTSRAGDVVAIQFAGHGIELPDLNGDEVDQDSPTDEALCPIDFQSGAYIIDDDIAAIFARTPAGVNVTCFFDCCHSGTSTRFAVGNRAMMDSAKGERARFLNATPERIEQHRIYRRDMGGQRALNARSQTNMNEVVFAACLAREVALESDGHGHFTLHATGLLKNGINNITNEQFQQQLLTAFGAAPRQNPFLDCAPTARARQLLQPLG